MPVKIIGEVELPSHNTSLVNWVKLGVGFTVIVNDCPTPGQLAAPPLKLGVILMVAIIGVKEV